MEEENRDTKDDTEFNDSNKDICSILMILFRVGSSQAYEEVYRFEFILNPGIEQQSKF
ncbi:Hypothetical predicted protein [Olea europaea subsp. europaea]|uniref:Uncharacterized protein n=1 Tax=Olea europaea subsp. europaea TaxID=158383 RepID=A0A8S0TWJ0_OLEEU|nr:Hypothetical predicted protein [Olea europaea subsp. europaea]